MLIYDTVVKESWIDYNEHMNVAFYYDAFSTAMDKVWDFVGVHEEYRQTKGIELQVKEGHIQFIQEAGLGEYLRIESEIFYVSRRGLLAGQQMFREGNLLCRFVQWSVTASSTSGQIQSLEEEVYKNARKTTVKDIELPDWITGRIKMTRGA